MFSLSTCWNSHRHDDGYDLLREVADLGFEWAEVSHGTPIYFVPGIIRAVNEGWIKISSLHNFCPLPPGVNTAAPNYYEPSARDRRELEMWYRQSLKTLEFAKAVGAGAIVLHSGSVKFFLGGPGRAVDAALDRTTFTTAKDDATFARQRDKGLARLRKRAGPFRERVLASFSALGPALRQANVLAGIENREGFEELPLDDDHVRLLDELRDALSRAVDAEGNPAPVPSFFRLWHDTGHAELKARQGILDHADFLSTRSPHLLGFHLHDVSEDGKDHQVPGRGVIDWDMVRRHFRPEHRFVLELSPRLTRDEVVASADFIRPLLPRA